MMKQKGFVTLAITSVLLTIVLGYSLSSYRGVLYQIKVANNEVAARQAHWQAEGGLECGFAHIVHDSATSIPTNLKSVCSDLGLSSLSASPANADTLVASDGNTSVSKTINFGSAGLAGAIRSTSDLVVHGSTLVAPPAPGEKNKDGEYECMTAVVSNYFIANAGVTNSGVGHTVTKPSEDFDNSSDCASSHKTVSSGQSGIWKDGTNKHTKFSVKDDFYLDDKLNPFKSTFGYERSEWEDVRDHKDFDFLKYTMDTGDIDCVEQFKNDLKLGKPNAIWITGSCQINSASLTVIKNIQKNNAGTYLFLLIHNGVVGLTGSGSIDGVIFHFNNGFGPNVANWDKFETSIQGTIHNSGGPTNFDVSLNTLYPPSGIDSRNATYLQDGSFSFSGGMIFDTQGQIALFNNSLNLKYNSDIETSFTFEGKPRWKKGSWNDL
ncbi:hypothetical protein AB4520_03045 [Vibrio renipiscarius]|uniref:hypothetical protein n=1 Tax=Vibrio renipiscarius TaxID=1461322 RepID=UPI00354DC7A8